MARGEQYIIKNFGLTAEQIEKLRIHAARHRASEAAVVRAALNAWFESQEGGQGNGQDVDG